MCVSRKVSRAFCTFKTKMRKPLDPLWLELLEGKSSSKLRGMQLPCRAEPGEIKFRECICIHCLSFSLQRWDASWPPQCEYCHVYHYPVYMLQHPWPPVLSTANCYNSLQFSPCNMTGSLCLLVSKDDYFHSGFLQFISVTISSTFSRLCESLDF